MTKNKKKQNNEEHKYCTVRMLISWMDCVGDYLDVEYSILRTGMYDEIIM